MKRADTWLYHTLPSKACCPVYGKLKRMSVEKFNKREAEKNAGIEKPKAYVKKQIVKHD